MDTHPMDWQRWHEWAQREIGGDEQRLRVATAAALAALARGQTPDEAAVAAWSSTGRLVGGSVDEAAGRRELLARVRSRRASTRDFAHALKSRVARLTTASIVCSSLVALLTAGPAFGGQRFTVLAQRAFNLPSNAIVWQALCFVAVLASIGAAVTTNIHKAHDKSAQLLKAESSQMVLEGLEVQLELGQLPVAEGIKRYQQAIAEIPFIPE